MAAICNYKKAFEIAVRCARELNGTPELKEAYQEAQKDNRALRSFMDFCLEKATEEAPIHTAADVVEVVRCKDCKHRYTCSNGMSFCKVKFPMGARDDDFCSYGERREGE